MMKLWILLPIALLAGCSTTANDLDRVVSQSAAQARQRDLQDPADSVPGGGFVTAEARQLLEACIELNNQDDRATPSRAAEAQSHADDWRIVYDSRAPGNKDWNRHWDKPASGEDPNDVKTNGFGPFNNAWLLIQAKDDPKRYGIAIRGTVAEKSSILNDVLVTTIPALGGIEYRNRHLPLTFAATPEAELHLGFAYGAFTLLFDRERGILKQLREARLPADAQLFVTGHSQGAAIATLVHSFLYYALTDPSDSYELGLKLAATDKAGIKLKSYLFAQPKPGNLQYAQDFARIAKDAAYVVNNDLDTVPQVPLSLQGPSEVLGKTAYENVDVGGFGDHLIYWNVDLVSGAVKTAKGKLAKRGAEQIDVLFRKKKADLDLHYFDGRPAGTGSAAHSLNYTLAGRLIPVFGLVKGGNLYPPSGDEPDPLLQHHATTYRKLMERQFCRRCASP